MTTIKSRAYKAGWQLKKRAKLKLKVLEYLETHPCIDCGEKDSVVLQFDHLNQTDKLMGVAELVNSRAKWEVIEEEIKKCVVRCANCHLKRTYKQLGFWKHIDSIK